MVLAESSSPAGARRRLRLFLRDARKSREMTQTQVADALDWSLSKVQRIENGEVTVSASDLKVALELFRVTDPGLINDLMDLARVSRRRKNWFDEARYRQHLTPAMMQLLHFELEATAIRVYNPGLIPGLLQTEQYARSIVDFWRDELPEEARAVRLEVRMRRKEHVLQRADPPAYFLALDESVLHRLVGNRQVMSGQLTALLELMDGRPGIRIRIVPYETPQLSQLSHFSVLDLGGEENAILYMEAQLKDELHQSPPMIELYRQRFEKLWNAAYDEETTARAIRSRRDNLW
jgi:transcriptional regulator with XRE-family HTH domain